MLRIECGTFKVRIDLFSNKVNKITVFHIIDKLIA